MGIVNSYFIEKWKSNFSNQLIEFNKANFIVEVNKEVQYCNRPGEYSENYKIKINTDFKKYDLTVSYDLLKDNAGQLNKVDEDLHLSCLTNYKAVDDFDEHRKLATERLNKAEYLTSYDWSFIKMESENGKFFEIPESAIPHMKQAPYKVICAAVQYKNENNEDCQDVGVIWEFNKDIRLELIFSTSISYERKVIESIDLRYHPDIEYDAWDYNNRYYLTIINKKTNSIKKFAYNNKLPKIDNM
jgi:hypothetical protein